MENFFDGFPFKGVVKTLLILYGQADRKGGEGGGVSPIGPECEQMRKFLPRLLLKSYSFILITHFISL